MRPCLATRQRRECGIFAMSPWVWQRLRMRVILCAHTLRIGDAVQVGVVFEYLADVWIGEAADHVLACQQGAEDLDFVAGDGIE